MRLPILALALLTLSTTFSRAQNSLYNSAQTRLAGSELRSTLGPKSGGIRYDDRMIRAAQIAQQRAFKKTTWHCWRYVKDALLAANVLASRPKTAYAKQAGDELCRQYGFRRLNIRDPYAAPVGAVIVYGGTDAGHVELRTERGFASDFVSTTPYPRGLIGIYVKPA